MENIAGKNFLRNKTFNILFLVVLILQLIPFILLLMMKSQNAMIWLIPMIPFVILLSKKNNPILSFNNDHLEYQAAAFGAPTKIEYSSIKNIEKAGSTITVTIENKKRPVLIGLINFNKSERENIFDCLETVFKQMETI